MTQACMTREQQKCGVIQVCIHSNYESVAKVNNIRMWGELEMCIIVGGDPGCRQAEEIVVEVFILLS